MKREIKFRAWVNNQMWYRGTIQFDMMPFELSNSTFFEFEGIESGEIVTGDAHREFDLMQYTGFKDKNGKEIYEADIVKRGDNELFDIEYMRFLRNVTNADIRNIEVVGNIYENAELLTHA